MDSSSPDGGKSACQVRLNGGLECVALVAAGAAAVEAAAVLGRAVRAVLAELGMKSQQLG